MRTGRSFSAAPAAARPTPVNVRPRSAAACRSDRSASPAAPPRTSRRCRASCRSRGRAASRPSSPARQQPVDGDERVVLLMADQIARRRRRPSMRPGGGVHAARPARTDRRSRRGCDRTSRPSETPASSRRCRTAASAGRPDTAMSSGWSCGSNMSSTCGRNACAVLTTIRPRRIASDRRPRRAPSRGARRCRSSAARRRTWSPSGNPADRPAGRSRADRAARVAQQPLVELARHGAAAAGSPPHLRQPPRRHRPAVLAARSMAFLPIR